MHTTTSLSSHFTWPLNCKLSVDSFLFKIAFLHLKINKRNKISPTLLPRRNFHFTSYLWGRKHRKFLAENFPSNMAYQFSLGLTLTPQRDDGHVTLQLVNFPSIKNICQWVDWVRLKKFNMAAFPRVLPKNLAMNSLCDFGRKIPQRFSSFCFRDRSLYNYRPRDQSWLVRRSWARGNMSCATPSLTT